MNRDTLALIEAHAYIVNTRACAAWWTATRWRRAQAPQGSAGAAIDVYETEPPKPDFALFRAAQCHSHPHWPGIPKTRIRIREIILLEIERAMNGLPPRSIANSVRSIRKPAR